MIAGVGVHNFRDLGGYPAGDGRRTRWRTLFRADGLHRLTEPTWRSSGRWACDGDRSPHRDESTERGRFPVDAHPVGYHHLSLMDVIWDPAEAPPAHEPATEFLLTRATMEMLVVGPTSVRPGDRRPGRPGRAAGGVPLRCGQGPHRPAGGDAARVARRAARVVLADYELTVAGMERMRAWLLANDPELAANLAGVPGGVHGGAARRAG